MSSLIGKPLQGGKYKLEKVLGRGGFGLTFRAHQTYLDQVVVIKTLNESFWSAPNLNDLQRQFQDEARRLALCSHPNVVRVSDFFIEDGLPYMVMDYIPGESLADIVSPGHALAEATAVNYIQQIGKALQAVHSKGLLHRDVKPQNIMIHELTGEAVLIDFGIARELTQNPAKTHTSIVSEGYAPIEQYLPKAQRSAATDIYGLAATLYTLLTGETPVAAVLRDRTSLTPVQQLRPDISDTVAAAITRGMAVELRDRPQSVGRWLAALTQPPGSTGRFNRITQPQPQPTAPPIAPTPAGISQMPTQVVAPGRPSGGQLASAATTNKTVAVPLPTQYAENTGALDQPKAKGKGCGCVSTLAILTLAIAGIFAGGGFWVYQQLSGRLTNVVNRPAPPIELPSTDSNGVESPEENPEDEATEPEASETDENGEEPEEATETTIVEDNVPPDPPETVNRSQPPLLLTSSGNPANARPGNNGRIVAVPGFSPGTSERKVRDRLGEPTQEGVVDGFYTSVYDLMPNRVSLAYVYGPDSTQVWQSEATFSLSTDRLTMRTTLVNMLNGRSTREIEEGLKAVREGTRDRFEFNREGFSGAIERNAHGHIHIYVQG